MEDPDLVRVREDDVLPVSVLEEDPGCSVDDTMLDTALEVVDEPGVEGP